MRRLNPLPLETESMQPSRRGLLGGISTLFAGVAAATVTDKAAAVAPASAEASPVSSAAAAAALETLENELIALSRRASAIPGERDRAFKDQAAARPRFYELCPKPPPDIVILDPSHPGAQRYGTSGLISAWTLRRDLPGLEPRSRIGRWAKKALKLAEAFEERRSQAKRESGLEAAEARAIALDYELRELVETAFALWPATTAGLAAQARIFLIGLDRADKSKEFAWYSTDFSLAYGPKLAEASAHLSDGGTDA